MPLEEIILPLRMNNWHIYYCSICWLVLIFFNEGKRQPFDLLIVTIITGLTHTTISFYSSTHYFM